MSSSISQHINSTVESSLLVELLLSFLSKGKYKVEKAVLFCL